MRSLHIRIPEEVYKAWLQYCDEVQNETKGLYSNHSVIFSNMPEIKKYTGYAVQFIHKETRGRPTLLSRERNTHKVD
ncbi:MAG: hypothetical protein ACYDAO_04235 [Thermoplasmataceae archaeon]